MWNLFKRDRRCTTIGGRRHSLGIVAAKLAYAAAEFTFAAANTSWQPQACNFSGNFTLAVEKKKLRGLFATVKLPSAFEATKL